MIAWDDVLEGGADSGIMIMYWRGWVPKAPVEAANNGNEVIMAIHCISINSPIRVHCIMCTILTRFRKG